jgi:hypothetical protein
LAEQGEFELPVPICEQLRRQHHVKLRDIEMNCKPSAFELAGLQQVFYRGIDQHVQELSWDIAGWHPRDLTIEAGRPLVRASPASYGFQGRSTQHVVYVTSDELTGGHVHELWRDSHGAWHDGGNLTAITGAPTLADGQPSVYAFEAQFTQHVFYRGIDGNIHELRWGTDTSGWHYWGNLTAQTGAPKAAGDPRGHVFVPQDTQHVVYNSADHHIIELVWQPLATNPQFLADVSGDKLADIVAFGDEGVWVALGKATAPSTFRSVRSRISALSRAAGASIGMFAWLAT